MSNKIYGLTALFCLILATSAQAQESFGSPVLRIIKPIYFDLPVDCTPGTDCWVMNYVDFGLDDGEKTDPACLARTYDGHKGTDFAVLDGTEMEKGVDVLAAADGTISRLRDGEKDGWHDEEELAAIKESRKECGNGIFIDHGNGVSTVYCHLKQNSIVVERGQTVKKGDKIAQIGQSGMAEFPHLHFGIIKNGKVLDPFTGRNSTGECGKIERPLWADSVDLSYQPLTIQALGFLNRVPDFDAIERKAESLETLSFNDEVIALWVVMLGAREGDKVTLEIKDPNGDVFASQDIDQEKNRARQYYFIGRKLDQEKMLEGGYTGSVKVTRGNDSWYKASAVLLTGP
jgi:hypothetical protein